MIEEQAVIANRRAGGGVVATSTESPVEASSDDSAAAATISVHIGDGNIFEVGAQCFALAIGSNNVLESKSVIGRDTVISDHSCIGAACTVTTPETLPSHTIIYSGDKRRVDLDYSQDTAFEMQRKYLVENLHKFHPLQKSEGSTS